MSDRIEERLGCLGFFGFGGGWSMAQKRKLHAIDPPQVEPGPRPIYCHTGCELADTCWTRHRERVHKLAPDLADEFEQLSKELEHGGLAEMEFMRRHRGMPDPYCVVMTGNIEDGIRVYDGLGPVDRQEATLPWPFKESES